MNIALLLHGNESNGGPAIRVQQLAKTLRTLGHTVDVLDSDVVPAGRRFDLVHVFNSWPLDSCLRALAVARRIGERVVFSPIALDLGLLPFYKDMLGAILNVRNPDTIDRDLEILSQRVSPKTKAAASAEGVRGHFEVLRSATALADHVICLSRFEHQFLTGIGADLKANTIVENSSDLAGIDNVDSRSFRRMYGLDRYVLTVGRLEYRKNQAIAAHAMLGLGIPLVLVGGYGDPGYSELVRKYSGNNVFYVGRVSDRKLMASAYAGADALLLPSWSEGASLAALEAGFVGTPLVLGSMSSEQEYFGRFARYVCPARPHEIRSTIETLVASPETEDQRRARRAALQDQYSFAHHGARTLHVYETALSQPPRLSTSPIAACVSKHLCDRTTMESSYETGGTAFEIDVLSRLKELKHGVTFACSTEIAGLSEIDPDRESGPGRSAPPHQGRLESVSSDSAAEFRNVASIETGAAPGYKDYGLWHRVPNEGPTFRIFLFLMEALRFSIGSVRRRLHARRRQKDHRRFSTASVGDVTCVKKPVRSRCIPAGARLLTLGDDWLMDTALLDELVRLVRCKGVRLETYVRRLPAPTASTKRTDPNDPLHTLLRYSDRIFVPDESIAIELRRIKETSCFAFEIRTCRMNGQAFIDALN